MPKMNDIQFHYTSLFGQDLSNLEPILRITSCMNPEDAELIGLAQVLINRNKEKNPERAKRLQEKSDQLQIIGMSKWVKGELTHLALRLGHRNKQTIDLSSDIEAVDANADNGT